MGGGKGVRYMINVILYHAFHALPPFLLPSPSLPPPSRSQHTHRPNLSLLKRELRASRSLSTLPADGSEPRRPPGKSSVDKFLCSNMEKNVHSNTITVTMCSSGARPSRRGSHEEGSGTGPVGTCSPGILSQLVSATSTHNDPPSVPRA